MGPSVNPTPPIDMNIVTEVLRTELAKMEANLLTKLREDMKEEISRRRFR